VSRSLLLAALLCLLAALAGADEICLVNGDRISGKVIGRVTRRVRVQTPYGTLVIPRSKVERIIRADGTEELITAPPTPAPTPTPPPHATLRIEVGGASFWRAWDPSSAPEDPGLRFQVRVDDRAVASYTDETLDPEDLPKAVVNSFVFSPEHLVLAAEEGVVTAPVEVAGGEVRLRLELPARSFGDRELRLAYQVNGGSRRDPVWWDVVAAECPVTLAAGRETVVRLTQERGAMEYKRRHMQNEETFRATVEPAPPAPPSP
jgi:hypothetical protein